MTLTTRKPTGKPSWPILLLAGREGTGKSFAAAVASASSMVDGAYWISYGEKDPDEYGLVKGANFDIVQHDGTYRDVLRATHEVAAQPVGAKPKLLIFDSGTRLWQVLSDNAQITANARATAKAKSQNRSAPASEATIGTDLWNQAAKQWNDIVLAMKAHRGPVIVTARLDQVSVMDNRGQPTTEKQWKVQAHKSLPYDVNAIVEMPERGQYVIKKAQSVLYELKQETVTDDFAVEGLWRRLGLEQGAGERTYSEPVTDALVPIEGEHDWLAEAEQAPTSREASAIGAAAKAAAAPVEVVDAIRGVVAEKRAAGGQPPLQAVEGTGA